ncbi:MAG: GntR family transcriptional regulator [Acidimicrobiales bacterium]
MTRQIRHVRLSDEVQRVLRRMILIGEIEPGRTSQDQLARLLGVSATPVREALLRLEAEGFVERSPNQSVRVLEMTPEDLADIYEAHAYLMGALARRACVKASPEMVARLRLYVTRSEEIGLATPSQSDQLEALNWQFHAVINAAAASPKMLQLLKVSTRYIPEGFYSLLPEWSCQAQVDHKLMLQAIADRDPTAAQAAAMDHVRQAGSLLVAQFQARDAAGGDRSA